MNIVRSRSELNSLKKNLSGTTSFVPTMGSLHSGHLSLVKCAKKAANNTIVSIYVNPTQFAPNEDFDSYPRDEKKDLEKLKSIDTDIVFIPSTADLYPDGLDSSYKTGESARGLETKFRPHFFNGVTNIVSRLFEAVKPNYAIFGEKDFQQLQVIKEMVTTYNMGTEIIGSPIIRDTQGLALSSRNQYLSEEELEIARQLNKVLRQDILLANMKKKLLDAGIHKIDYIEKRWDRILVAAWLGKTRLIDNIPT